MTIDNAMAAANKLMSRLIQAASSTCTARPGSRIPQIAPSSSLSHHMQARLVVHSSCKFLRLQVRHQRLA